MHLAKKTPPDKQHPLPSQPTIPFHSTPTVKEPVSLLQQFNTETACDKEYQVINITHDGRNRSTCYTYG